MRKLICLSIIVVFIAVTPKAQVVRFGVDPGIAISKAMYKPFSGDRRVIVGFDGGVLAEIGKKNFKFQPEVNYSMNGIELNSFSNEYSIKNSSVNIPLLIKYKMKKVSFLTGFQIDFLLSSKTDTSGTNGSVDFKDQLKSSGFDWVIGGEINFTKNIFLAVRYNVGLTNISDRLNFEMKNRFWSLRLGYMFDLKH